MNRQMVDRMLTIVESERVCRKDLSACRNDIKPVVNGWDPKWVIPISIGIVLLLSGGAFVLGYSVGK